MRPSIVADTAAGTVIVTPAGELDVQTSHDLRSALLEAGEANRSVVVDLSLVSFIDACALGVLTAAHRRLATNGCRLVLVGVSERVVTALRVTGLLSFLDVHALAVPTDPGLS